ncbi:unannotated protein [freshwater metagenome]|uniref:Unannotated protein n=1 Tax=freshwater metagenome TaxID=449393 RepID=A0A6J7EFX9_9ZZZZ|nr:hypothetical protein [Actinomycetota bacterium]
MSSGGTLFGHRVQSAFPHRRLAPAPTVRGTLEIARGPQISLDGCRVIHRDESADAAFTIARADDGALHVSCTAAGGFRLEPEALRIVADGACEDPDVWEHRLVTVVVPLLLAERGEVALHAAALARGGRAVAFAGASTRGKSTLALAAAEAGMAVIADDAIVIARAEGGALVWPGPTGLRVAPPGAQRKHTVATGMPPPQRCPLAAVVVLGDRTAGAAELTRLAPAQALPALVPSLIFAGSDRLPAAMADAAWLASTVPVLRCRLPDGIERLADAIDNVLGRLLPEAPEFSPADA